VFDNVVAEAATAGVLDDVLAGVDVLDFKFSDVAGLAGVFDNVFTLDLVALLGGEGLQSLTSNSS